MTDINKIFKDFKFNNSSLYGQFGRLYAGCFAGENEEMEYLDRIAEKYILGQSIVDIADNSENVIFTLSNGLELHFNSNEGCGGCGNGWYTSNGIIDTRENGNIITRVEVKDPKYAECGTYSVFIYSNDKRIIQADFSGSDNGYYGVGIWAELVMPEDVLIKLSNGGEI